MESPLLWIGALGWLLLLIVAFGILVGKAIAAGSDPPEYVTRADWERVSHVPHTPSLQRRVK